MLIQHTIHSMESCISKLGMTVMAGFLALATLAQLNDPDSSVWIAAYALPMALTIWICVASAASWLWQILCVMVVLGLSLFAGNTIYKATKDGKITYHQIIITEEGRESAGLLIVIVWLLLLLLFQRKGSLFPCGLLAFAVVPPSIWVAYKFFDHPLSEHCKGLI